MNEERTGKITANTNRNILKPPPQMTSLVERARLDQILRFCLFLQMAKNSFAYFIVLLVPRLLGLFIKKKLLIRRLNHYL